MELTTVKMTVPKEMVRFLKKEDDDLRNAMILYPVVKHSIISHEEAAEIIGIDARELKDLYDGISLPYIHLSFDDIHEMIDDIVVRRDGDIKKKGA